MARTTTIEPQFAAWLAAVPIVAANAPGRVYPWAKVPQNKSTPYLTYHRVGGLRQTTLKGPTTRLMRVRIQVDVWGGYEASKLIADPLRQAIDQDLPQTTIGTIFVQAAKVDDDRDDYEPPRQGDEKPEFRVMLDITIWFEEG